MRMMKHRMNQRCDAKLPGSARASWRAGNRVLAIANFLLTASLSASPFCARGISLSRRPLKYFGEGAEMCTRGACAPQNKRARRPQGDGYS